MDGNHQPLELLKYPYYDQVKGDIEELPALDAKFCQDVYFPLYCTAPATSPEMDPSIWENWIEILTSIEKNLTWLMKLPHHKFWCQVINSNSLHASLDSYLKLTPRFQTSCWPDEVLTKHNAVHKLVFMCFIRMATFKESSKWFITPEYFGDLLYDYYLFDIPKILDLCSIYGNNTNSSLLGRAILNIFKNQPNYNDDLNQTVDTILEIFYNLDKKCGLDNQIVGDAEHETNSRRPYRLSEGPGSTALSDLSLEELKDIVFYISDTLHTLSRFLVDVYPTACDQFYKKTGIIPYLAKFYSTTLTTLRETVKDHPIEDLHLRSQLLAHLKCSRKSLLSVVRQMTYKCLLTPALNAVEAGDKARTVSYSDQYLQVLSELLAEPRFFADFKRKLPVLDDVQSLLQASPEIDETRASFILGSLGGGSNAPSPRNIMNGTCSPQANSVNHNTNSTEKWNPVMSGDYTAHEDLKRDSLISAVHEVLPHLGDGFIDCCLRYYDDNYEKTINALLEESLPDDLLAMDRSTPRQRQLNNGSQFVDKEPESAFPASASHFNNGPASQTEIPVLQGRRNVYDDDEFDVYKKSTVDLSKIHIGKKDKRLETEETVTPQLKQIYERYSMVSDEEEVTDGMGALTLDGAQNNGGVYDDEYDDMYDGLGVDANDADSADELLSRRPFVTPRVFQQQKKFKARDEAQSDDSDDGESAKPDHFIANPVEVRAKQEERWRQKQELRHRNSGGRPKEGPKPANTLHDRRKKDENKARVANHSRKRMAAKKASKGMGPM